MTKKSYARQMRDTIKAQQTEELDNNRCWDELHGMYATCAGLFVQYSSLGTLMKNQELMACVQDLQGMSDRIMIMRNDLEMLKQELLTINSKHKNKNGGPVGDDVDAQAIDLMNSIEIFQHYELWLEKHNANVVPTFNEISAALTQAESRLRIVVQSAAVASQGGIAELATPAVAEVAAPETVSA